MRSTLHKDKAELQTEFPWHENSDYRVLGCDRV